MKIIGNKNEIVAMLGSIEDACFEFGMGPFAWSQVSDDEEFELDVEVTRDYSGALIVQVMEEADEEGEDNEG